MCARSRKAPRTLCLRVAVTRFDESVTQTIDMRPFKPEWLLGRLSSVVEKEARCALGQTEHTDMEVHVMVSQVEAPLELREWISARLHQVLGAAVSGVLSVAVVMNPISNARVTEPLMRCSMVVTTPAGRRVVETRDAKLEAAVERAMRLVSLSLFGEEVRVAPSPEKPAPLV